jgi:hypothetical protein
MPELLFSSYSLGEAEKKRLNQDGHLLLPQRLTTCTRRKVIEALRHNLEIPVAVRYAWRDFPNASLVHHSEGLPVAQFRSDKWAR